MNDKIEYRLKYSHLEGPVMYSVYIALGVWGTSSAPGAENIKYHFIYLDKKHTAY